MVTRASMKRSHVKLVTTLLSVLILARPLIIYSSNAAETVGWFERLATYTRNSSVVVTTVATLTVIGSFFTRNFLQNRRADLDRLERFERRNTELRAACDVTSADMRALTGAVAALSNEISRANAQAVIQRGAVAEISVRVGRVEGLAGSLARQVAVQHAENVAKFADLDRCLSGNLAQVRSAVERKMGPLTQRVNALNGIANWAESTAEETARQIAILRQFAARRQSGGRLVGDGAGRELVMGGSVIGTSVTAMFLGSTYYIHGAVGGQGSQTRELAPAKLVSVSPREWFTFVEGRDAR